MAKPTPVEEQLSRVTMQQTLELHIVARVFAGLYRFGPKEHYVQAVADLMDGFRKTMKDAIAASFNKMQVSGNPHEERPELFQWRKQQLLTVEEIVQQNTEYLVSMYVHEELPPHAQP